MPVFHIMATWDNDAAVWVATSKDVPGLIVEAETKDQLIEELQILIPELIQANEATVRQGSVPMELLYQRKDTVCINF